ncbi:MAG TPA: ATP-binding cassette domain-containing protein [Bacteroidales bacterium]|nr:ATP-binding cassette domain-containing protein [Bacteroidales bacterium]HRW95214.1 ATP-binding cassette domain-containing protein [Bacteroidales bacterium]
MIKTRNLTKKFGELIAVDNLNLSIAQGELFSLLGLNGAGKTTTIKMLSCLIRPSDGSARVMGKDLVKEAGAIKQKINVSPQETAVAPNLTVQENLKMIAGVYGLSKNSIAVKVNEMIKVFSLEEVRNKKAKLLSGGMQRRLSIAMALITEPRILFLDEPTLGLDVLARRELWAIITKLKETATILLTTHYMEEAEALSDRVAVMIKGKICANGTVKELLEMTGTRKLEDAFIQLNQKEV